MTNPDHKKMTAADAEPFCPAALTEYYRKLVVRKHLVVQCITNIVTVNDCANILLACGGSPIMSDDADDVEDI